MNTIITPNIFQVSSKRPVSKIGQEKPASFDFYNNGTDVFEYQGRTPSFKSVNVQMAKLRRYSNDLGCAYTDKNMISAEAYNYIMNKIKTAKSDKSLMAQLQKYSKLMDDYERKIFNFYRERLNSSKGSTFESVTNEQFSKSASKLLPMYLSMVNRLEVFANEMPDTKLLKRYRAAVEGWKQDLLNGNYEDSMVSDKYQNIIEKMRFPRDMKELRARIIAEIDTLPTQSNDFDAFIVKHKNSTRRVILKRLIRPYTVSIEHVKPRGKGGHANSIGNCMLVRTKDNNDRSTDDIMKYHPERKKTIVAYFRRVIDKINNGGMKDILYYPFEFKKSIEAETHNAINLEKEIARLKITEEEAYKTFIV